VCGITGIISPSATECLSKIDVLTRSLAHRGDQPPATRTYAGAALGCARLAIVDRAYGSQPMETGSLSVVFNGEIYNHADLRSKLQAEGACFENGSDTEVLLHGYALWGETLLDRIEGMYAFVLVDRSNGTFLAARDPFGIKPLYYSHSQNSWFFSSEIHPLVAVNCEGIRPVPPGGFILNGEISGRTRYEVISPLPQRDLPLPDAIRNFKTKLGDSVLRHMPPDDLPVAIFLSGGIDSSAILFEAVQACNRNGWNPKEKLRAYSVGTRFSEDPDIASRLAAELGVPFSFEEIAVEDMIAAIPLTIRTIESFEPNHIRAGTTSLALARRVARDGFKVALLGEGADELLGGYEEFPAAFSAERNDDVEMLLRVFSGQLHRTQLRRVDRTAMAHGLEARVPFLDRRFVRYVLKVPTEYKVHKRGDGRVVGKHVLREAYRHLLPDYIVDRRKVPMGEGAGIGDNRPLGAFYEYCGGIVSDEEFKRAAAKHPEFKLRNKEEAHYFSLFRQSFGALTLAADRPRTNALQTT
jgi:asparagine synthase (glutamine-hydrolysing)